MWFLPAARAYAINIFTALLLPRRNKLVRLSNFQVWCLRGRLEQTLMDPLMGLDLTLNYTPSLARLGWIQQTVTYTPAYYVAVLLQL
jgi:hypothetical protein